MHVGALQVYPVKSLRGVPVTSAEVERPGLRGDRRWMLVDAEGRTVTAREHPGALAVTAWPAPSGGVELSIAGREPLVVEAPTGGEAVPVALSRVGHALAAGADADAWLSDGLGAPVRLVWLDDPARRPVSARHGGRVGDPLSLADTGPLLVTVGASLRRLDAWVRAGARLDERPTHPLAMERFRPNLVVEGDVEPFAEDSWPGIRIGDVELRFAEHCDRCVLTTIDPETRQRGHEPIRTLARHRRWDGKVWFGVRMVPVTTGTVRVGDPVSVLPA